jgi:uncharacterized protein YueI
MQKILILSPLDETNVFTHASMYKILAEKCNVLSVPMYADYLLQNKIAQNEEEALIFALKSIDTFLKSAEKSSKDIVIIGNCTKDNQFNMIIGFNKATLKLEAEPDLLLTKMQQKYKEIGKVNQILSNLYAPADCESFLIDSELTAKFVLEYLDGVHNGGTPDEQARIQKEKYGRA